VRRRARRMGFRSGRKRRQTDWIVSAQGSVVDPSPQFGTTTLITLIDNADLDAHQDQLTVVRIVGEIHFRDTEWTRVDGNPIVWRGFAGIYKAETDAAGAVFELQPDDGIDADSEAWLWRHSFISHPTGQMISGPGAAAGDPMTTSFVWNAYSKHIDLRVMRKMGGRELLVLAFRLFDANAQSASYGAELQLRTLVKLV